MPQLRADQLDQHLARGVAPLYVVHGDEPLLSLEAADAIRTAARKAGCTEREVMAVERGFEWAQLGHAAAGMSLFADRKLIELRIPNGKPGNDGAQAIEQYCAHLVEENVTLVSLPRLSKADQSSGWFTSLSERGVVVNVFPIERARLPQWIGMRLARQKQRADEATLAFLADSVEGNLLAAHQEIQKLALLCPEGALPFDQVRDAVLNVARHSIYQLAESMLAGDASRAARVSNSLRGEGEEPPRVLWVLAEDIRAIARIQIGLSAGRPLPELLRENRIWGEPRLSLMGNAVRRVQAATAHAALERAALIDKMIKGVAKGDVWDELLALALWFAPRPDEQRMRAAL